MKILAIPRGLASVDFASVKVTAPVIDGAENAKVSRRIAETMFAMNSVVFIYLLT